MGTSSTTRPVRPLALALAYMRDSLSMVSQCTTASMESIGVGRRNNYLRHIQTPIPVTIHQCRPLQCDSGLFLRRLVTGYPVPPPADLCWCHLSRRIFRLGRCVLMFSAYGGVQ